MDGESVLLNLESGEYFGLSEVGTRMWAVLVAEEGEVERAIEALVGEYAAGEEEIRRDLAELIEELAGRKLLEIRDWGPLAHALGRRRCSRGI
jgi:hypothetical protein